MRSVGRSLTGTAAPSRRSSLSADLFDDQEQVIQRTLTRMWQPGHAGVQSMTLEPEASRATTGSSLPRTQAQASLAAGDVGASGFSEASTFPPVSSAAGSLPASAPTMEVTPGSSCSGATPGPSNPSVHHHSRNSFGDHPFSATTAGGSRPLHGVFSTPAMQGLLPLVGLPGGPLGTGGAARNDRRQAFLSATLSLVLQPNGRDSRAGVSAARKSLSAARQSSDVSSTALVGAAAEWADRGSITIGPSLSSCRSLRPAPSAECPPQAAGGASEAAPGALSPLNAPAPPATLPADRPCGLDTKLPVADNVSWSNFAVSAAQEEAGLDPRAAVSSEASDLPTALPSHRNRAYFTTSGTFNCSDMPACPERAARAAPPPAAHLLPPSRATLPAGAPQSQPGPECDPSAAANPSAVPSWSAFLAQSRRRKAARPSIEYRRRVTAEDVRMRRSIDSRLKAGGPASCGSINRSPPGMSPSSTQSPGASNGSTGQRRHSYTLVTPAMFYALSKPASIEKGSRPRFDSADSGVHGQSPGGGELVDTSGGLETTSSSQRSSLVTLQRCKSLQDRTLSLIMAADDEPKAGADTLPLFTCEKSLQPSNRGSHNGAATTVFGSALSRCSSFASVPSRASSSPPIHRSGAQRASLWALAVTGLVAALVALCAGYGIRSAFTTASDIFALVMAAGVVLATVGAGIFSFAKEAAAPVAASVPGDRPGSPGCSNHPCESAMGPSGSGRINLAARCVRCAALLPLAF